MASGDNQDTNESPKTPRKKAQKLTQKEQSERFMKTARDLGVDETSEQFERAISKIVSLSRGPQNTK